MTTQKDESDITQAEILKIHNAHNRAVKIDAMLEYKPSWWRRFCSWLDANNPFGRYLHVRTVDEYTNLPWKDRSVFRFWYLEAIIVGSRIILGTKSERESLENFIQGNYPLQYFIRQTGNAYKIKLGRIYDWIRHTIRPRQKWLVDKIPKDWADKVSLIPDINFAMVIHFVEDECCFDSTDYDATSQSHVEFAQQLRDCYDYIKVRRPQLQLDLDNSYPDDATWTGDFFVDYAENNRLTALLNNEDTKYLVWIVTNRDYFWT